MFNPQHLITAFELYDSQFDKWSWNQRDLFWRQVIGYVQRFLPANIAMDFAQGLYSGVENKKTSARAFKFKYDDGAIFPLVFDSFSGLGYEFGVAGRGARVFWGAITVVRGRFFFKTYVEQKQRSWENYTDRGLAPFTSLSNSVM